VAERLTAEFGRGYTDKNLRHMIRFFEAFPDREIVYALSRQLSWTQFRSLIYLDDPLKRDFYAEMCRIERWNTRTLQKKIGGMLFERTSLSRKPERLATHLPDSASRSFLPVSPSISTRGRAPFLTGLESGRMPEAFRPLRGRRSVLDPKAVPSTRRSG
jgi:hypothetical protein